MKLLSFLFIALTFVACNSKSSHNGHYNSDNDYAITTKDKKITLVLTNSKVYMKLAPKFLAKINKDLNNNKSNKQGDNWTDKFSHFVISNVKSLVNQKLEYSIDDIKDVTYEDGTLKFTYYHSHIMTFKKVIDNDKPALACFNTSDAKNFVQRFQRLKSR